MAWMIGLTPVLAVPPHVLRRSPPANGQTSGQVAKARLSAAPDARAWDQEYQGDRRASLGRAAAEYRAGAWEAASAPAEEGAPR